MPLILWAAAGVAILLVDGYLPSSVHHWTTLGIGSLSMLFGVWVFWRHGGPRITGAGLYSLSISIFVGFASIWWWSKGGVTQGIYAATITGWWTTFGMYVAFWRIPPPAPPLEITESEVPGWGIWMGLATSVIGLAAGTLEYGNGVEFFLGGMSLLMVSLMLKRGHGQKIRGAIVPASMVLLTFWFVIFSGAGRLNLVGLALVGAVIVSMQLHSRRLKAVVLVGMAPAIALLSLLDTRYPDPRSGLGNGLGSVVNPLRTFGELLVVRQDGQIGLVNVDNFVATSLFWIPRSIWSDKPEGFGAVLTELLRPEYSGLGYTLAALSYGEWFYSGGWLGVVAMVFVIGYGIQFLDKATVMSGGVRSRLNLVRLTILVLMTATIPTFAWVGSFTYVARTGQQVIVLALVVLPFAARNMARNPVSTTSPRLAQG